MTKTKTTKKKPTRKRAGKKKTAPHIYREPRTAAELGIVCSSCGGPALWFDYEIGEKDYMKGFVCDAHKRSTRLAKLAVKEAALATIG